MMSLRARLFAHLAAAAVAGAVLTAAAGVLLARSRDGDRRQALVRQTAALAAALPTGTTRVFAVRGGRVRPLGPVARRAVLARLPAPPRGEGDLTAPRRPGRRLLWAGAPSGAGSVVLVRPAARQAGDPGPLAPSLALAGAAGGLLAAGLAAALARRLGRPLGELAAAAAEVGAGRRASVPVRGEDEVAGLARAFNAMSGDLAAAREAERTFLLSVSHELKTPLTAVRGYAEALADGAVAPAEAARIIGAESERLERLVGDLLELGRLERRAFAVEREPIDLADVARETAARLEPRARAAGVALAVDAPAPAPARGDHGRALQVAANLVENALRTASRVTIAARPGELAVADDGPGLEPGDGERAFERFYLHDRFRDARPVGSGLGLAVVSELARAMGGEADVRSAPGHGATFRLRLPGA
jgi:signal transduction histidine kinase